MSANPERQPLTRFVKQSESSSSAAAVRQGFQQGFSDITGKAKVGPTGWCKEVAELKRAFAGNGQASLHHHFGECDLQREASEAVCIMLFVLPRQAEF